MKNLILLTDVTVITILNEIGTIKPFLENYYAFICVSTGSGSVSLCLNHIFSAVALFLCSFLEGQQL